MSKYIYPAIFTKEPEGGYSVHFPDIEGCFTCGDDLQHALAMAEDVLTFALFNREKRNELIPIPSTYDDIQTTTGEFITYIQADTLEYHKRENKKPVKRMISLPSWLDDLAKENRISLSKALQESLAEKLHIKL